MRNRHRRNKQSTAMIRLPTKVNELETYLNSKLEHNENEDLFFSVYQHQGKSIAVFGITYLIYTDKVESSLLGPLLSSPTAWNANELLNDIPIGDGASTTSLQTTIDQLLTGHVFIYIEGESTVIYYPLFREEKRSIEKSESESIVIGPQLSFTESLDTNLNIIRQLTKSPDLILEKLTVGHQYPREVRLIYLRSMANETDVNTMRQRIQDLNVSEVEDITVLQQFIEDNTRSIFPQFYTTELPNRLNYVIQEGKIAVLMENSSLAFIAPSTFLSFFESMEDLYMRWPTGTALRTLRLFAAIVALFLTPLYVSIITYQYELIPTQLLISIGQSRSGVPFPPIFEALFIELIIELLREAGARLPTKVGQTMGIVGGIVIGEAAVSAGLASNILIIVVAISALASFTTPSYLMGTSLRVLRFPMIIIAGLYGLIGMMFGVCFLIIHLLKMKSLGRPYLSPIYPLELPDFNNVLFRTPPDKNSKRANMYQPKNMRKFSAKRAKKKHDIDE